MLGNLVADYRNVILDLGEPSGDMAFAIRKSSLLCGGMRGDIAFDLRASGVSCERVTFNFGKELENRVDHWQDQLSVDWDRPVAPNGYEYDYMNDGGVLHEHKVKLEVLFL